MKNFTGIRGVLVGAFVLGVLVVSGHADMVEVRVTVEDYTGKPLENVALTINDEPIPRGVSDAITDTHGRAIVRATLDGDVIYIRQGFARPTTLTHEEQRAVTRQRKQMLGLAFQPKHPIRRVVGQRSYDLRIVGYEAVNVTATFVDTKNEVIDDTMLIGTLFGMRRGVNQLIIADRADQRGLRVGMPVELTAEQLDADVDLGNINVPDLAERVDTEILLVGDGEFRQSDRKQGVAWGVILISKSGDTVLHVWTPRVSGREFPPEPQPLMFSHGGTLRIPEGEYCVAVHTLAMSAACMQMLNIIRDGTDEQRAALTSITITENGPPIEINIPETYDALMSVLIEDDRANAVNADDVKD
ncbi:MAG: hypothetical protein AAF432_12365 [Planctomycetota bacterium]